MPKASRSSRTPLIFRGCGNLKAGQRCLCQSPLMSFALLLLLQQSRRCACVDTKRVQSSEKNAGPAGEAAKKALASLNAVAQVEMEELEQKAAVGLAQHAPEDEIVSWLAAQQKFRFPCGAGKTCPANDKHKAVVSEAGLNRYVALASPLVRCSHYVCVCVCVCACIPCTHI